MSNANGQAHYQSQFLFVQNSDTDSFPHKKVIAKVSQWRFFVDGKGA